jgi:hypothetical protein
MSIKLHYFYDDNAILKTQTHYCSALFFVSGFMIFVIKPPKTAKYKVLLMGLEVMAHVPLAHPIK